MGASLALTVAIYDLLVRPYRVTRFLFGMKNPPAAPRAVPAPPRLVADAPAPAMAAA